MAIETIVTPIAPSQLGCAASWVQREEAYQPIIDPSMNTSPWAKLISLSTPYTIV